MDQIILNHPNTSFTYKNDFEIVEVIVCLTVEDYVWHQHRPEMDPSKTIHSQDASSFSSSNHRLEYRSFAPSGF
ncbi:hypothetical protein QQG55_41595 [Brugia pahangi]